MTGDTAEISTISSNGWYDWIKFYDPVGNSLPEDKYYLRRYLGPAIDIGPALTAKILKMNGYVVHRSTYRSLTAQDMTLRKIYGMTLIRRLRRSSDRRQRSIIFTTWTWRELQRLKFMVIMMVSKEHLTNLRRSWNQHQTSQQTHIWIHKPCCREGTIWLGGGLFLGK